MASQNMTQFTHTSNSVINCNLFNPNGLLFPQLIRFRTIFNKNHLWFWFCDWKTFFNSWKMLQCFVIISTRCAQFAPSRDPLAGSFGICDAGTAALCLRTVVSSKFRYSLARQRSPFPKSAFRCHDQLVCHAPTAWMEPAQSANVWFLEGTWFPLLLSYAMTSVSCSYVCVSEKSIQFIDIFAKS